MAITPLTALLAAGGVAVAVDQITDDSDETKRHEPLSKTPNGGSIMDQVVAPGVALYDPLLDTSQSQSYYRPTEYTGQSIPAEIEQEIIDKWKKEYESLTGEAKAKACAEFKAAFPNDPGVQELSCDASFEEVYKVTVAALSAAAGAAASAVCGPPCGALAAIGTVYLGKKLEDEINEAYNNIKDFAKETYEDAKDGVVDLYNSIVPW